MERLFKFIQGIIGLLLIVIALVLINQMTPIPFLSEWLLTPLFNVNALGPTLFGAGILVGLIGLWFVVKALFKPTHRNQLIMHHDLGKIEIPKRAIAHELQYRILETVRVVDLNVNLKMQRNNKAKVKVQAAGTEDDGQLQAISKQIEAVVHQYCQERLGTDQSQVTVQLQPRRANQSVRVI